MNIANPGLLAAGILGLTTAYELVKVQNFIGAGIAAVAGIIAIVLYDQLPPTQ